MAGTIGDPTLGAIGGGGLFSSITSSGLNGFNPVSLGKTAALYSLDGAAGSATFIKDSSNRVQLIADQSGNSPVLVLAANGVASNTVTSSTQSVTGNQVFTAVLRLSTYHPAAQVDIIAKTSGNNGFTFSLKTDGTVRLTIGDGAALTNYDSTAVISADAFLKHTITATYVDGGSGSVIFAVDGVKLGATVSTTKTLTDAAVSATISAVKVIGAIYGVSVGSVYNFDPTQGTKLAATVTSGAAVWTINTSGDLGARISGERDLVQLTQSKQPIYLPYAGTKFIYTNAVSGNTVTAPTHSVTGSQVITLDIAPLSWTPGSTATVISKLSGNNGFDVAITTAGAIQFRVGNGTTITTMTSSATVGLGGSYTRATIGITWTDGVGTAFTLNGNALGVTQVGVAVLADSGTSFTLSSASYAGYIYSTVVGVVYSVSASTYSSGATFTGTDTLTYTINAGATVVTAPGAYLNGSTMYIESASFSFAQPESIYFVGNQTASVSNAAVYNGVGSGIMDMFQASPSPDIALFAGGTGPTLTTWTLKTLAVISALFNGASSTLRLNTNAATSPSSPSGSNGNGFTIGSDPNGINTSNITFTEAILRSAADSTATQLQIAGYMKSKFGF